MSRKPMLQENQTLNEIDNTLELTLLNAIEQIVSVAHDSAMSQEMFETIERPLNYLCERMELETEQALLFAIFVNMYYDNQITQVDIGRFLDITPLRLLRLVSNIDPLISRGLICESAEYNKNFYYVPYSTIEAVKQNNVPSRPNRENLSLEEWFEELEKIVQDRKNDDIYFHGMQIEIDNLVSSSPELDFVQQLKAMKLNKNDVVIFLTCCNILVNEGLREIRLNDILDIFDNKMMYARVKRQLTGGKSDLLTKGLLQLLKSETTKHKDVFELGDKVVNEMLTGLDITTTERPNKYVISHKNITSKSMYYNPKEQESIEQLTTLMQPEKFREICERLSDRGMRKGFTCLFYGAPGTGKTETVLQLARITGRDLLQVNVNDIKSMWVGESEKNIKEMFNNYRNMVSNSQLAPILFFNEADSIINKRMKNAERSVDKMENSIQNIILQEMENLEGIMIATTNLTQNMDKAFERRFLYKIEFAKPSLSAKSLIWQSMIPELSQEDATGLAQKYDFSGGQI